MGLFPLFSLLLAVAAVASFANYKWIGLPSTIGVMLIALAMSLGLILANALGLPVQRVAVALVARIHFREVLLDGVLAFLLFAGALHVDLDRLLGEKLTVSLLATVGVLVSTLIVGGATFALSRVLGLGLSFSGALLFGALISPTDPIAVLGIMRSVGAPPVLEVQIAGESLFNDGIGVVLFATILAATSATGGPVGAPAIAIFVVREIAGSLALGFAVGWLVYRMLRLVDNYQVEVLLTLALAMGVYSLAAALHMSGPLAVVVAGLLVGNTGRARAMSPRTIRHLDTFWELIDEILNVALFVLIGFELLIVPTTARAVLVGCAAILLVLLARFLSVGATMTVLRRIRSVPPHAIKILTWGGLRGAISVALALSLGPDVGGRDLILNMTYVVVVFSIVVQGLTIGPLVRRAQAQ
jgi:CPA1 family monovalent cation:H+ antiporter